MANLETKIKLGVDLSGIEGLVLAAAQKQYPNVALSAQNTIVTLRATRSKEDGSGVAADIEFFPVLVPEAMQSRTVAARSAGEAVETATESKVAEAKEEVAETETVKATEAKAESTDDGMFD